MRYFIASLTAAAWALWFGGMVTMFLLMNRLFQTMHPMNAEVFDAVAPDQFMTFERFEMVIGGFTLLCAFGVRVLVPRRAATGLFGVLFFAGVIAVAKPLLISKKMFPMIHPGWTPTDEFRRLHGLYMMSGGAETLILLIAAFFLPAVMATATRPKDIPAET